MVNMKNNFDLVNIVHGSRCSSYDRSHLFNKEFIKEIKYSPSCHECNPEGII